MLKLVREYILGDIACSYTLIIGIAGILKQASYKQLEDIIPMAKLTSQSLAVIPPACTLFSLFLSCYRYNGLYPLWAFHK